MKNSNEDMEIYLKPTYFMDYDTPEVAEFAQTRCDKNETNRQKAIKLYYAVRDEIRYNPYDFKNDRVNFKASSTLKKMSGYCVAKAVLLAAVARFEGIPARLGFADVRNHISTSRLRELMKTDVFMYHGYVELFIDKIWVKATPAFNLTLCTNFNIKPLNLMEFTILCFMNLIPKEIDTWSILKIMDILIIFHLIKFLEIALKPIPKYLETAASKRW